MQRKDAVATRMPERPIVSERGVGSQGRTLSYSGSISQYVAKRAAYVRVLITRAPADVLAVKPAVVLVVKPVDELAVSLLTSLLWSRTLLETLIPVRHCSSMQTSQRKTLSL